MKWRVLMVFAVLVLAACNRVQTSQPLFGPADRAGAPALRDGVWLFENKPAFDTRGELERDEACEPDRRRPPSQWPDCATWFIVEGDQVRERGNDGQGQFRWDRHLFLLTGGEPSILQALAVDETGETTFHYFSLKPTATGAGGKITAFEFWNVECGPPPPQGAGQPSRYVTLDLSPGLTFDGDNCTTDFQEAVRNAALAGRSWQDAGKLVWVTDRYR